MVAVPTRWSVELTRWVSYGEAGLWMNADSIDPKVPAIILAAALGNAACVAALLSTSQKIDLAQLCLGLTALMHASKEGHTDCVKVNCGIHWTACEGVLLCCSTGV